MRENYPEFIQTSLATDQKQNLKSGDKALTREGLYTEPFFPHMFSMEILQGTKNPLSRVNEIMLSASLAAYSYMRVPIGKTIRLDSRSDLAVSAVFRDFPANSEFLLPIFIAFILSAPLTWLLM